MGSSAEAACNGTTSCCRARIRRCCWSTDQVFACTRTMAETHQEIKKTMRRTQRSEALYAVYDSRIQMSEC